MKLSRREKIGLGLLGMLLLGFIYYRYLYIPQSQCMIDLQIEKQEQELEQNRVQKILDQQLGIQEKLRELNRRKKNMPIGFFTNFQQQDFILLLEEWKNPFSFEIVEMSFSEPFPFTWTTEENPEDPLVGQGVTLAIRYEGDYNGVMDFLKKVEDYPKKIVVDQIQLQQLAPPDRVSGSIRLDFLGFSEDMAEEPLFYWDDHIMLTDQQITHAWIQKAEQIEEAYKLEEEISWISEEMIEEASGPIFQETEIFNFNPDSIFFVGEPKEIWADASVIEEDVYVEYHFFRDIGYRRINMVFDELTPVIETQPQYIQLPTYSLTHETHKVGMVLRDALGKEREVTLANQLDWTGWKELKGKVPIDMTYPVVIQRIYIETPVDLEYGAKGSLLFKRIERVDLIETEQ